MSPRLLLVPFALVNRVIGIALIGLVRAYQLTLGRLLPPRCRFHPSCSSYAIDAIRLNGALVGVAQTAWRLARCAPWGQGGIDEVRPVGRRAHGMSAARSIPTGNASAASGAAGAPNLRKNLEATTMGSHG